MDSRPSGAEPTYRRTAHRARVQAPAPALVLAQARDLAQVHDQDRSLEVPGLRVQRAVRKVTDCMRVSALNAPREPSGTERTA